MLRVGRIHYSPLKFMGGSCIYFGDKWVLTAGHCVKGWSLDKYVLSFPGLSREKTFEVEAVNLHPERDLALLKLKKAPKRLKVFPIVRKSPVKNSRVWLGGFGLTGTIGETRRADGFRSGHNRVDGLRKKRISISLSEPGEDNAEPDEAAVSTFDSGSPLLVEESGQWKLAGIAATATRSKKVKPGLRSNYVDLAACADWIERIVK